MAATPGLSLTRRNRQKRHGKYSDFCQYLQVFTPKTCRMTDTCPYLPFMKQATADFYLGFYVSS